MNKHLSIIWGLLLLTSCVGKHHSEAQKVVLEEATATSHQAALLDTLFVDIAASQIHWKGTKLRGTKKHEGDIQLYTAYLLHENGQLKGGEFRVDMNTLGVTDIPPTDPIPIRNINQHLKSEDFFDVEKYPCAVFTLTDAQSLSQDSLDVSGVLKIKGISKSIRFKASKQGHIFATSFRIDRFMWNIAEGSWTDKTVVDREIELRIILKTQVGVN